MQQGMEDAVESKATVARCLQGAWLLAGGYPGREEQPFRISRKADCPSAAEDAVMTEPNKALHSRHERHERLAHGMLNGLWQ